MRLHSDRLSRQTLEQAPKRKRPAARPSNIPTGIETCIRSTLKTFQKQSSRKSIYAQEIQSELFDPLQLQDEKLKQEILQQYPFDTNDAIELLLQRIWQSYQQQQRAQQVFSLLDEAGKGVVVLHDLQRVAQEMLEEDVSEENLEEMIREFDQSGDGLLYPKDILRIARLVGLQE